MHIRVANNVYTIGGSSLSGPPDNNVYLVIIDEKNALIYDTGSPMHVTNTLRNLLELGISVQSIRYIVLSHAHLESSGAAYFFYNLIKNAETVAHEPDATKIRAGDKIYTNAYAYGLKYFGTPITISIPSNVKTYTLYEEPSVYVVHTPGHTPGLITLVFEKNNYRVAFCSDAIGPLCDCWGSSREDLERTLHILLGLEADLYCLSTGCVRRRDFIALVDAIREMGIDNLRVECCRKSGLAAAGSRCLDKSTTSPSR